GFEALFSSARARVTAAGGANLADERDALLGELLALFAHQAVRLSPQPRHTGPADDDSPRLNPLARAQLAMQLGHLATVSHTTLALDPFSTRLAALLDGNHTLAELSERMLVAVQAGELELTLNSRKGERVNLRATISANVQRLVELFRREGVFERQR
ncbi:MAG TPA: hypothetical protein VGE00_06750, partial [Gammaproteobacteria bacterium]